MVRQKPVRYLVEREGRFWARCVIPADLRGVMGKRELRAPLGPDRTEAKRKLHHYVARFQDEIAAARARANGKHPARITRPLSLPAMAHAHYEEALAEDEDLRHDPRYATFGFPDEDEIAELRRAAAGASSDDEMDVIIGRAIRKFVGRGNTKAAKGDADWRRIGRTLAAVELEIVSRVMERNEGDVTGEPKLPILKERPSELDAPEPVSLLALADDYFADRARLGRSPETAKRWRIVVEQLAEHLGHDDVNQITPDNLDAWLVASTQRKAASTVKNVELVAVKAILSWAKRKRRIATDPAADIVLETPKKRRTRDPGFSDAEASTILKAARDYTRSTKLEDEATALAKSWLPWLAAHTGGRISELAQLRSEDVKERDGVVYIEITPDAGSVKSSSFREVPLHAQLIERGFVTLAKARTGPLFYDGTKRRKAGGKHPAKAMGEKIGAWVRSIGIDDVRLQPSHGWRHRHKTIGRDLDINPRVLDAIHGHSEKTTSDGYGTVSLKAKAAAISRFPHYKLD